MATEHSTLAAHSSFSTTTKDREALHCCYCQRPITKRIRAAQKSYCGKLCAAMGLIADVHEQDGIDDEFCIDSMNNLLNSMFNGGPRAYPVKVRWSDALDLDLDARPDFRAEFVVIDDEGTPDWVPCPRATVVDLGEWKSRRGE